MELYRVWGKKVGSRRYQVIGNIKPCFSDGALSDGFILGVLSHRTYRIGAIINPTKVLKATLAAMKAQA